ncbi:MAG: OmpA family protein [Paludibacteraceae bacterium]|nr:OmpA family protein [Paludibacteraceae bacterium]
MKKYIFATLLALTYSFASAQVVEENTTVIEGGNSTDEKVVAQVIRETRSKDFCHWMISIGGGVNLMLTERESERGKPVKNYSDNLQGAGYFNVGYMINPIWGIIAEYGFIPINKKIFTPEGNKTGFGHEATLQLDFNILNLVRKCRKNTKWNVDALVGVGFLAYNSRYNIDSKGEKDHYYFPAICVPVSLKFQYCPIDELGIALRLTGKWYSEDDINYIWEGIGNHNNDMAIYAGLELQYNITTSNKKHVRVTDRCTYEPMNVVLEGKIVDVNKNTEKIDDIEKDLDSVKQDVAVLSGKAEPTTAMLPNDYVNRMNEMQNKIDSLKNALDGLASRQPNIVPVVGNNADVNINKEGDVYVTNNYNQSGSDEIGIYFEFDSSRVQQIYFKEVIKIAKRLKSDDKLKAKIIGYCDSRGSVEYNKALARKRINAVIYILVNKFNISRDRITTDNVGEIEEKNEIYDLNRRVDVEFFY